MGGRGIKTNILLPLLVPMAGAARAQAPICADRGANFGLNRNTPDVEVYAGIATRF
jgi:hypothetical protein